MPHIEVKTRKIIDASLARKIIAKGSVIAVITTGRITQGAKDLFNEADIAWTEYFSEQEFMESEAQEE